MSRHPFDRLRSIRGSRKRTKPHPNRKVYLELEHLERRMMPVVVRFSSATYAVLEDAVTATVTVTLDVTSSDTITVDYTTSDGTATDGMDYTGTNGTLTFNPSETAQTFTISIYNDAADEYDETVDLTLSNPTNASLGSPSTATLTITDDDAPPTAAMSTSTGSVSESTGYYTAIVILSAASGKSVTVDYATSGGTATAGTDYTTTSGTLTFTPGQTSRNFNVPVTWDEASESDETITVSVSNPSNATLGAPTSTTVTITNSTPSGFTITGTRRATEWEQGFFLPFGAAEVAPQDGSLVVRHGLDFRRSRPSANDSWSAVGVPPALVYISNSVNVKPIIEATVVSNPTQLPTSIQVQLTWNGGAPQSAETFGGATTINDQTQAFAVQVSSAVASTAVYSYQLQFAFTIFGRGPIERSYSGTTPVVVNGSSDPFGYGWSIAGFDRLVADGASGMLWVAGAGGYRYFSGSGSPTPFTYTSPANDFGALVKNADNTYTYTEKDQDKWYFDSSGNLTKIQDSHSLTRTFTYANGLLDTAVEPDGGTTSFSYSSSLLTKITEPGGRAVTVTIDGSSNLTGLTNPDNGLRTFTYDDLHRLINDKFGPLSTTMVYDATESRLTSLDRGQSSTLSLTPAAVQAMSTRSAKLAAEVHAVTSDALSQTGTFTLDNQGRLTKLGATTLYGGVTSRWDRNSAGQVTKETDALSRVTSYTYDASKDLTQIDLPTGGNYQFQYHSTFHTPTRIQDTLNHVTTLTYDGTTGDLLTVKDALNNTTTLTWSTGLLQTVTDPLAHTTTFQYESGTRRLEAIIDATLGRTTFTYDSSGFPSTIKDAEGRTTTTQFDGMGHLTKLTDAIGGVTTITYNALGQVTSQIDPLGRTTEYTIGGRGFVTAIKEAVGTSIARTTTLVYDVLGRVTQRTDGLNHTVTMTYDAASNLRSRTNPLSGVETFTYDQIGRFRAYQDGRGNATTYTYSDSSGGNVEIKDALNSLTTIQYDTEHNVSVVIDARGNRTTFTYDEVDQLTARKDALDHTITLVYDAAGNVSRFVDALNNSITFTYDELDRRVTQKTPALGVTTTAYDKVSNVVNVIDANNNKTTFVYDNLNRLKESIDARGGVTTTVYDAVSNVVNIIDSVNNKTTFVYDALNRLTEEKDPLGNSMTHAYDAADRLTSRTDRLARRRDFTYDNADRLLTEAWITTGSTVNTLTYTYDANGNALTAKDADGTYTLTYDAANQLKTQKDLWNLTLTFTYDGVGNRTKVEDSLNGVTTSTYNAGNLLTKREFGGNGQTPLRFDLTYTNRDQLDTVTRYSDLAGTTKVGSSTFTYDTTGRLETIKHRDGSANLLANFTYTYDVGDRVLTETLGGSTKTYTYDSTDQLTNDNTTTFTYDLNGNRTMTGYQTGTANRLTNDGTYTYTYDAEGNLTKKSKGASLETWEYGYDHWNHMTWAEKRASDGGTLQMRADYKYDVFGNRIEKAVDADGAGSGGTTTTRFAYDGTDIWADLDGSSALQTRYLRGDIVDQLFARISAAGTAAWYLTDRLGSTRNLVDASGTLISTLTYDAWGTVLSESSPSNGDRWKWTGRELDSETSLQFNRERYLQNPTGRWTTEDPIGFTAGDANLSRYVRNNPVSYVDPTGTIINPDGTISPNQAGTAAAGAAALIAAMKAYWPLIVANAPAGIAILGGTLIGIGLYEYYAAGVAAAAIQAAFYAKHGKWMVQEYDTIYVAWWMSHGGAKSIEEYYKHTEKLAIAQGQLDALRQQMQEAKGPKKKGPLQELIDEMVKQIKGHLKEIRQKWPNGPPKHKP